MSRATLGGGQQPAPRRRADSLACGTRASTKKRCLYESPWKRPPSPCRVRGRGAVGTAAEPRHARDWARPRAASLPRSDRAGAPARACQHVAAAPRWPDSAPHLLHQPAPGQHHGRTRLALRQRVDDEFFEVGMLQLRFRRRVGGAHFVPSSQQKKTECGVNGSRAAEGGNAQAPRPTEVTRGGAPEVKKKVNRRYRDALDQRGELEYAHLCCHPFRFSSTFSTQLRVIHHAQTLSCTPRHILPAEMSSSTS